MSRSSQIVTFRTNPIAQLGVRHTMTTPATEPIHITEQHYDGVEHPAAFPFDEPGECFRCNIRIGAWLQSQTSVEGDEYEVPVVRLYYAIDEFCETGMCESCHDDWLAEQL